MEDFTKLWDDYSIKFNGKLIYECENEWKKLDTEIGRAHV